MEITQSSQPTQAPFIPRMGDGTPISIEYLNSLSIIQLLQLKQRVRLELYSIQTQIDTCPPSDPATNEDWGRKVKAARSCKNAILGLISDELDIRRIQADGSI
ncbi:hypothetical protein K9N68_37520 (plasmid) [Kovacikia minuta CCNUW1]|uniref:hypothetical protein n=1 Tax=Kovacikia minuta TaxID=2931930 RepID=UPI001CCF5F2B|nr:hypothetical protein [Kovacikia minuta]UBF29913.1 hypothetical protein K9N68_37520 [Kovacikia minuta CCNUW1]